jgi:hypothetical protein
LTPAKSNFLSVVAELFNGCAGGHLLSMIQFLNVGTGRRKGHHHMPGRNYIESALPEGRPINRRKHYEAHQTKRNPIAPIEFNKIGHRILFDHCF